VAIANVLDEIFVLRLGRRMPARRALVYLAIIVTVAGYTFRNELRTPAPFVRDMHAVLSLDLAVNRAWCGLPSSLTRNPDVGGLLLEQRGLADTPISSVVTARWGSISGFCATSSEPYVNNENSLMLTEAWLLKAIPGLSLSGIGRAMLALKLSAIVLLCFVLLQSGAGVLMCAGILHASAAILFELQKLGGFGVYSFFISILAAAVAMYGLGFGRRGTKYAVGLALVAGVATAFAVNMRTSYLPLLLVFFAIYVAAAFAGIPSMAKRLKLSAIAVLLFVSGYALFHYPFVVRTRVTQVPGAPGYTYHVVAHPLVLSLAAMPNDLAKREGIEWEDGVGLTLARRINPAVSYLGPGYDNALFTYYVSLWRKYPAEMVNIYLDKWRIAGSRAVEQAAFDSVWMNGILDLLRRLPNGLAFQALFAVGAIGSVLGFVRTRAPIFVPLAMLCTAGTLLMVEAALIVPTFALTYHSPLLFVSAVCTLVALQLFVSVAVAGIEKLRQPSSLSERTIADFGDQWTVYTDNSGFYGSPALLQDVFGPLLRVDDFKDAVIADIGAGTGRFTNVFVASGAARVVAVEPSRAFDVLMENTSSHRDRVQCLRSDVERFRPADQVDFAFSYGVLHHIPNPEPAVAAMRDALKPGGRIGIWLYGREGNETYIAALELLTVVTRRLPHSLLAGLVWILYGPLVVYMTLCRWVPLPLGHYLTDVFAKLSPDKRRLTIYDQLNPAYAKYYWQPEVRRLLTDAGFVDIRLFHRHGYSWTAVAVKP
jgi:SAM-dependent methyltransferase